MDKFQTLKVPRRSSLISLFLFLQVSISFNQSWGFIPADNYLIHCGSSQNTEIDNRIFVSDDSSSSGTKFLSSSGSISLKDQNPIQGLSPLYQTARVFTKPSNYKFEIKEKGTHLVRLHFLPFDSPKFDLSNAHFHVSANGYLLLSNFTSQNENFYSRNPILKEYLIWVDSSNLDLLFVPSKQSSFAFVNAIEVISAPKDLIADIGTYVSNEGTESLNGLTRVSLETIYRINVGGHKVTPFNDTVWRTWIPDDGFLKLETASKAIFFTGHIKYKNGGATREVAPDNVYNSARIMSDPNISMPNFNITWVFPVSLGDRYLVRMHFCDIASMALNELFYDVYVNGFAAYKDLDLSEITGMLASPFYADFIVDAKSSEDFTITVGPSRLSSPGRVNAILNGLEIMKVSNLTNSVLDDEISLDLQDHPKGHNGMLLPSVVLASLLIAAYGLHKRRTEVNNYMGWSQLPVDIPEGK